MTRHTERPAGQRQLRVGEALRHALADVFERGELRDPALSGVPVTVTEVRISPDLRNATVFVMPLGGGDAAAIVAALEHAAPYLRRRVAEVMTLRYAPALSFRTDDSFDYADRIDALLHDPAVARDLDPAEATDGGDVGTESDDG